MEDRSTIIYRTARPQALLSVTEFGRHRVGSSVANRQLPSFAAVLLESGRGSLETAGAARQPVTAPSLFWLLPGMRHGYGPDAGTMWEERWVLFTGALAEAFVADGLIQAAAPLVGLRRPDETLRLFGALQAQMAARSPLGDAAAAASLHQLVVSAAAEAAARTTASDRDTAAMVRELHARAFEPIDLSRFARRYGISPATLRRRFVAATGLAPKVFQLRVRLDRAKELLAGGDRTIEEIAGDVGFEDSFYFARLFFRRERSTPSDFRRRNRRQ